MKKKYKKSYVIRYEGEIGEVKGFKKKKNDRINKECDE